MLLLEALSLDSSKRNGNVCYIAYILLCMRLHFVRNKLYIKATTMTLNKIQDLHACFLNNTTAPTDRPERRAVSL